MNESVRRIVNLGACLAVAAGTTVAAFAAGAVRSAEGRGTIAFGHEDDDEGRAYLRFEVTEGDAASGSLLVAAEHHHGMYPDVVIRLESIEKVKFEGSAVKIVGDALLHDDPVRVVAVAIDGAGTSEPDTFTIVCRDPSGEIVFEAEGDLYIGDVSVSQN
jgi:hypothetical protein